MGRRARGEGNITKKSDKLWQGTITLGYQNGKQIRKTCSGRSQQECKRKLDELKKQYGSSNNAPISISDGKQPYIDFLLNTWLPMKRDLEKLKASTIETHKQRIELYLKDYFKNTPINKVSLQQINKLYTMLASKISGATVHKVHAIINNSFKYAVRQAIVVNNPATYAVLPKHTTTPKDSLTPDEIKALLKAARIYQDKSTTQTPNVYPLIALAINTGCRRGELAALQVEDVDLDNNKITIRNAIMEIKGKCYVDKPKTEASQRTIYISPEMTEILRTHIENNCKGKYLFPNLRDSNRPQTPSNISRFYYAVVKLAGLSGGLHITRHTHITQLLEQGVDIKTIQQRAGHTQISTTMGYCHPDKELDKAAANIFSKFM